MPSVAVLKKNKILLDCLRKTIFVGIRVKLMYGLLVKCCVVLLCDTRFHFNH